MRIAGKDQEIRCKGIADHWHALYTRHQHEKSVTESLSNKGYDVFLPIYSTVRRWHDRTKQLSLPLFPCYVLIRGGMDRQLQILKTPGLISIVGWIGGRPAIIPQEQIDSVRLLVESSLPLEPHPLLQCGDLVRIQSGPLFGVEGILIRKKATSRLVVSIEMLGQSVAVEIDVSQVVRIGPFSSAPTTVPTAPPQARVSCQNPTLDE